jgi:hypothetical protein
MLEVQAGVPLEEFLEWFPLVRGGIIQQNYHRASQMPQQPTQKQTGIIRLTPSDI